MSKFKKTIIDTSAVTYKSNTFKIAGSMVIIFVMLVGSSLSAVLMGGQTGGASDTRIVKLRINGEIKTIPTRAKTVGEFLERTKVEVMPKDKVSPALETPIVFDETEINVTYAKTYVVSDGDKKISVTSANQDPKDIIVENGLAVSPEDIVSNIQPTDIDTDGLVSGKINIDRAMNVVLNIYGEKQTIKTQASSVGEVLGTANIKLAPDDQVSLPDDTKVVEGQEITVSRFGTKIISEEAVIAFNTLTETDPNAMTGTTVVKQEGVVGKKLVSIEINLKNDKEIGRKVIQEVIVSNPVDKIIVKGTKVAVVAPTPTPKVVTGATNRVHCGSPAQNNTKNVNTSNLEIGRSLAAAKGWTGAEFDALAELWACESSWNHLAGNPYSGAYGIPQSLPASKMATFGADYATNPTTQIAWGLNYIAARYGKPSAALSFHYRNNWY